MPSSVAKSRLSDLSSTETLISEARNGRMLVLVDDEQADSGGYLVIPAQMTTPDAVNFMARHGRGLICLALTQTRVSELGLAMMPRSHAEGTRAGFTVSIEARQGVSTGISAADRSRTILTAIDHTAGSDEIVSPGHVFPIAARDGGVLIRAGEAEAAVDIVRLAGLNPSATICQILTDQGTTAKFPELSSFANQHHMKIGSIRDLIAFRMRHDHLVELVDVAPFRSDYGGDWRMMSYRNKVDGSIHYALVKGEISPESPTLVRVHTASVFADMLGQPGPRKRILQHAMVRIGEAGAGVIVLIVPTRDGDLRSMANGGLEAETDMRTYGAGAQILAHLEVHDMILLTSAAGQVPVGLDGFGLRVVDQQEIGNA
jgi:3,4-dihydroxy 2-butanone 4-phosphate synthase / GTP cyclohydrolase II